MKNTSSANIQVIQPQIKAMKKQMTALSERIDCLETLTTHLAKNLDSIEEHVIEIRTALNIPVNFISFLKPMFRNSRRSNITSFVPVDIIDLDRYFITNREISTEKTNDVN